LDSVASYLVQRVMQAFKEHFAQLWFYSVAGKALGDILLRKEVALFTVSQMKAFE